MAVRVLAAIEGGPLQLDELIERLDVPASPVLVAVTEIELAGLARKTGGYVALAGR